MKESLITNIETPKMNMASAREAVALLVAHGYDRKKIKIPPPAAQNIEHDRIYFLLFNGTDWEGRTAFLEASLDKQSIKIKVEDGWQIEREPVLASS